MLMQSPPHPGRIIRSNLEALDISVSKSAEALGVDRSQLHRVISGKSAISPEMAMRLEKVIGSTADHWMRMQVAYDLAELRKNKPELVEGLQRLDTSADAA